MKWLFRNTVLLLSLLPFKLNAQCHICIDTVSYAYFNAITDKKVTIETYEITNNSNEEYLTWISLAPQSDRSTEEQVLCYFKQRKGDFSFLEMMYEGLLNGQQHCTIGYSFLKSIKKGECFSYSFMKTESDSQVYRDRIVLVKRKDVETILRAQLDSTVFYRLSSIVLVE